MTDTQVLIAGGGPFGLMLANELGRRGVRTLQVDAKPGTAVNPQANATQARTMEYFRRLGFADEIRALGLPPDHPTDVAYFTRFAGPELARFRLPSSAEARAMVARNDGPWAAAEAPHRVSQKYVEAVLRRHAEALPGVSLHFSTELVSFTQDDTGVTATLRNAGGTRQVRARYLVGADGPRSLVRRTLGLRHEGETGVQRDFFGGRMYAVYLRCPDFHARIGAAPAWMHFTFNADRRAFMAAVDGTGAFTFHTQLRADENEAAITEERAAGLFHSAVGRKLPCQVISHMGWTAGHALVAERFGAGRVLLGGDAAHLFTPAGGLGYNTAVEDAVNLGWKLAACLRGIAGPGLLPSYEAERQPVARRNTGYARAFARSIGEAVPPPGLEDDTPDGARLRAEAGAFLASHGRREFNIPGITFGSRYDNSPVIAGDGATPPPDTANDYHPSAVPGGRPPHWWLPDGRSLYDLLGLDWTLLRLGSNAPAGVEFAAEATRRGLDLRTVAQPVPELAARYEAPLVLIRPDQMVGWRGPTAAGAARVFDILLGHA